MYLTFDIQQNSNKNYVYMAIKKYLDEKSLATLVHMLTKSIAYVLSYTEIDHIKLSLGKINSIAKYYNGEIILNERLVVNVHNLDLVGIYVAIFHELSHAIIERKNLQILYSGVCSTEFCPTFCMENIFSILYQVCGNKQFATGATMFLYLNDKNEVFARENSYYLAHVFFSTFLPSQVAKIPRYEKDYKENLKNLFISYPEIKNKEHQIVKLIENYQIVYINEYSHKYVEKEIIKFLSSLSITFSENVKQNLINECINTKSTKFLSTYLSNPMFNVSDAQKKQLQDVFTIKTLQQTLYKPENLKKMY